MIQAENDTINMYKSYFYMCSSQLLIMDVLTDVLKVMGIAGAFFARSDGRAPWGLHFNGAQLASFHIVTQGTCWLWLDGTETHVQLAAGDIALLPQDAPHTLADAADSPVLEFGTVIAGRERLSGPSVRVGGTGAPTVVLCGAYSAVLDAPHPVLSGLPPLMHLPAVQTRQSGLPAVMQLLATEAEQRTPGSQGAIDCLVDVLLVYVLRIWFEQHPENRPGWVGALNDRAIGRAITLIHEMPGKRWTVAQLANEVGLSRATFARHFAAQIGEPPLAYLTKWRMAIATQWLHTSNEPLAIIAERVGYDSAFAFATAFKRARGESPGQYRSRVQRS